MSRPCPPSTGAPPPRARRHSSCELCFIQNGDPVWVHCVDHNNYPGPLAGLSPAGVTIEYDNDLLYFPWTSVLRLRWQPVKVPDDAQRP